MNTKAEMKDLKKEKGGLRPLEIGIKYVSEDGRYYLVNEGTGEKERLYFKSDLLAERKRALEEVDNRVYEEARGRASFAEHDGVIPIANVELEFMGAFDDVIEEMLSKLNK